ncbi:MAG TPA: hypothetical protein VKX33_03335 [Cyclobacteriaceae bacterium]|nr:hypothetical protein [Cyclobacteriaceae bacterium]
MYTGILHLHSGLAYLVILGLLVCVIYAMVGALSGREFTDRDRKFGLIGLIPAHIQFLFAIILYFVSPLGFSNLSGETMGDATARLYAVEHPLINLIAVALVTIGYSRAKKLTNSTNRFRTIYLFYGVAFILILSRIPWATWMN